MSKELLYQNKKIFYRLIGNGRPVALIHGFGEDSEVWENQVSYLKDSFQLIIPDLPGCGQSQLINDMTMEGMAETIHAILHKENIDTCTVIGHSMGGYIVLALAEKYWNHLDALGLFHSSAYADNEEKKVARRKGIDFINGHGAFEFLQTTTPNLFSSRTTNERPELIDQFLHRLSNFSPATLVSCYEAMMQRPDRTELLSKTPIPVLFIMGEYDNAVPLQDGLRQCHLPGKSYIHILHQSAHMGMLEEAETSNRILEKFLHSI